MVAITDFPIVLRKADWIGIC